jgi:hypothetical protein
MQQLNTAPNELLASALHLADLGVSVIPLWWPEGNQCACSKGAECESPAKHPLAKLTPNGLKDATTNAHTITAWWQRYPNANIGLVTGGEIDVIDVDGAIPAYQALIEEMGAPEHVATVLTGRGDGGLHIYCTPGGNKTIPSGKHGLPNKIEVKGAGGYVVAPPSRHVSGGTYTYLTEITGTIHGKTPLAAWLAELDTQPAPVVPIRPAMPSMPSMPSSGDNVTKYRNAVIQSACDAIANAGEGGRWMALATEAVPKIARGIDGGLIEHQVGVYALEGAARQSGLSANEVARIPEMVDLMLAQGIREPIRPPQDLDTAVDNWLRESQKMTQASCLPNTLEAVNQRTTWWPIDLDPVLRGEVTEHAPEFLTFTDGQPLFYAGKVNGIIGESESGKTWLALEAVTQALARGQRVLYMDFEDTAPGIVSRLKSLGVTDFTNLAYMSPDEGFGARAKLDLSETLHIIAPDLAILDGFNAAMNVLGLDINSNNDATTFAQLLLKPVAATGVCLVYVDHVPKSKDARGKGGIGAQAKRAMTTGCTLAVTVLDPFGRGNVGRLAVSVDKDRAGHVRGYCNDARNLGAVTLTSDKATGDITVDFDPFDAKAVKESTAMNHRDAVLKTLAASAVPMNQAEIVELLRLQGHTIGDHYRKSTFQGLATDGLIVKADGGWKLHENDLIGDDDDD